MSKNKRGVSPLTASGRTPDGKTVVTGVFPIFSSLTGLPLEDIIDILNENNMVVDWLDFYDQAMKEGWKPERTIVKIRDAVGDVFGSEYGDEVKKRLNFSLISR